MADVPLSDDLAFAPEDPFPLLNGFGEEWPYRSMSLINPHIYYVRIGRTQPRPLAEESALNLGLKIAEGGYAGLIMDYRGAVIDHDGQGFLAVSDAFAANFPRQLLIAYLHDEHTRDFAQLMRGFLVEQGLKCARMSSFEAAWTAILKQLNSPAE
jgi:hypothetical protein